MVVGGDSALGADLGAARDAALIARMIVCKGLPMKTKHLRHVNARMDVWRKGYCLLCDVNGTLYVYAKKRLDGEKVTR